MPSQDIRTIEVDGKKYDVDSLSADARTAVVVIEELNGKINGFRKEAHFLEVTRGAYEGQLSRQLPSKSLEDQDSKEKNAKQNKTSGKSTANGTKSG
jgi:TPP-dependent trihydroxycyclohexane-1,2-dione (THcHDO) dehydratase